MQLQGARKYTVRRYRKVVTDGVRSKVQTGSFEATLSIQPLTGRELDQAKEGFNLGGGRAYKAYGYPNTELRYENYDAAELAAQVTTITVASSDDGLYRVEVNREAYDYDASGDTAAAIAAALKPLLDADPAVSVSVASNVLTLTSVEAGSPFELEGFGPNGEADLTIATTTENNDGVVEPDEIDFGGKALHVHGEFPNAHYGGVHATQRHRKYVLSESDTQIGRPV